MWRDSEASVRLLPQLFDTLLHVVCRTLVVITDGSVSRGQTVQQGVTCVRLPTAAGMDFSFGEGVDYRRRKGSLKDAKRTRNSHAVMSNVRRKAPVGDNKPRAAAAPANDNQHQPSAPPRRSAVPPPSPIAASTTPSATKAAGRRAGGGVQRRGRRLAANRQGSEPTQRVSILDAVFGPGTAAGALCGTAS